MPIHAFSPQWNTVSKWLWYNSLTVKGKLGSKWLTEMSWCDSRGTSIFMGIFLLLLFTLNKSSVCTLHIWKSQKVGKKSHYTFNLDTYSWTFSIAMCLFGDLLVPINLQIHEFHSQLFNNHLFSQILLKGNISYCT